MSPNNNSLSKIAMLQAQIKSMRSEEDTNYAIYEKQAADIKHMKKIIQYLMVKMQELQKSVYETRRMVVLSGDHGQEFEQIHSSHSSHSSRSGH